MNVSFTTVFTTIEKETGQKGSDTFFSHDSLILQQVFLRLLRTMEINHGYFMTVSWNFSLLGHKFRTKPSPVYTLKVVQGKGFHIIGVEGLDIWFQLLSWMEYLNKTSFSFSIMSILRILSKIIHYSLVDNRR